MGKVMATFDQMNYFMDHEGVARHMKDLPEKGLLSQCH